MNPPWPWLRPALPWLALFALLAVIPLCDPHLPLWLRFGGLLPSVFIFAIVGLGLNVITGWTGLLHLGCAAFMAIGAYAYAILTGPAYPFQIGFWPGVVAAVVLGAAAGMVLAVPTLRLRGDYLAIVTLGFGEIVQDSLRNLEGITGGTQGITPVPRMAFGPWQATPMDGRPAYWITLALLALALLVCRNLRDARTGRAWLAVRDDQLAAGAMGVSVTASKLSAAGTSAGLCALGGGLWAALHGSSIEPGYYDYMLSVIVLCIVLVGGLGSLAGVLVGSLVMIGFNAVVLTRLGEVLGSAGGTVGNPANWKYLVFGLVLVLVMRLRPQGLIPMRSGAHG